MMVIYNAIVVMVMTTKTQVAVTAAAWLLW